MWLVVTVVAVQDEDPEAMVGKPVCVCSHAVFLSACADLTCEALELDAREVTCCDSLIRALLFLLYHLVVGTLTAYAVCRQSDSVM